MKRIPRYIKIIAVIFLILLFANLSFKLLLIFRKNNLYNAFSVPAVDGKSFYVYKQENHSGSISISNSIDTENSISKYTSVNKPGVCFFSSRPEGEKLPLSVGCFSGNEYFITLEYFWDLNADSFAKDLKLVYHYPDGKLKSWMIPYKENINQNPGNIIFFNENSGFFRYDPLADKYVYLCKIPDFRKDLVWYFKHFVPKVKIPLNEITLSNAKIICGNKPGDFVLMIPFDMISNYSYLCYIYSAEQKKLIKPFLLPGWTNPIHSSSLYISSDDRFVIIRGTGIVDTSVPEILNVNLKTPCLESSFYTDKTNFIRILINESEIYYSDSENGNFRTVYKENGKDCRVVYAFWFPEEKCIIADIYITNNPGIIDGTSVIAIDPQTGNVRQIIAPCPFYTKKNERVFSLLMDLSDKAQELKLKIPHKYRWLF
ncbi:MAG: hypothetical protein LWY06_13005 [Firmicutes bacterium]|nr:hypothetical protein [Bacillota bacterium]